MNENHLPNPPRGAGRPTELPGVSWSNFKSCCHKLDFKTWTVIPNLERKAWLYDFCGHIHTSAETLLAVWFPKMCSEMAAHWDFRALPCSLLWATPYSVHTYLCGKICIGSGFSLSTLFHKHIEYDNWFKNIFLGHVNYISKLLVKQTFCSCVQFWRTCTNHFLQETRLTKTWMFPSDGRGRTST